MGIAAVDFHAQRLYGNLFQLKLRMAYLFPYNLELGKYGDRIRQIW
jgi:hypothetical protein